MPYIERRIAESLKLGFKRIILPKKNLKGLKLSKNIELLGIEKLGELAKIALA